jgi:hypothetical protein
MLLTGGFMKFHEQKLVPEEVDQSERDVCTTGRRQGLTPSLTRNTESMVLILIYQYPAYD